MRARGVCPECGLPGIPYLYGLPSGLGRAKVDAGLVVLGGCEIYDGVPGFRCPRGHDWSETGAARAAGAATGPEAEASRAYASGSDDDAERAYRALLDTATERHGEHHPETIAFRHALTLVLSGAGRTEDAEAVFAPIRRKREDDRRALLDRLQERHPE